MRREKPITEGRTGGLVLGSGTEDQAPQWPRAAAAALTLDPARLPRCQHLITPPSSLQEVRTEGAGFDPGL